MIKSYHYSAPIRNQPPTSKTIMIKARYNKLETEPLEVFYKVPINKVFLF